MRIISRKSQTESRNLTRYITVTKENRKAYSAGRFKEAYHYPGTLSKLTADLIHNFLCCAAHSSACPGTEKKYEHGT
jgi:hypothetical protein